jgi:hypothetical protein
VSLTNRERRQKLEARTVLKELRLAGVSVSFGKMQSKRQAVISYGSSFDSVELYYAWGEWRLIEPRNTISWGTGFTYTITTFEDQLLGAGSLERAVADIRRWIEIRAILSGERDHEL